MRVVARQVNWDVCPTSIAEYAKEAQTFLTVGREYEVYAVAAFRGSLFVQVINDLEYPAWRVGWLFDVLDSSLPDDWICSLFHEEPVLVIGPEFVARDRASYAAMVELKEDQVARFWKRIDRIRGNVGQR